MTLVIAHDIIHANISHLPPGQAAGYTTGSPDIRWTEGDWLAHPGAVRIDQDVAASDGTADVLDVESGAATFADCPGWVKRAQASIADGRRPGQRHPAIYMSASNITHVVNSLAAGGVHSGVGLWVANWSIGPGTAGNDINDGSGPFPVIGVQYASGAFYDTDLFSSAWLVHVSGGSVPPAPPPPPARPVLKEGDRGGWVSVLQSKLNAHGQHVTVDGDFGPATKAAVEAFQKDHGLVQDGVVGPLTWKALG